MNLRKAISSKKGLAVTLVVVIALGTGALAWSNHRHSATPSHTTGKCSGYYTGLYDNFGLGAGSIKAMANDYSQAIVVATVENPKLLATSMHIEDPAPQIKITQVIKGSHGIYKGAIIPICSGMGHINIPDSGHPTVLVFLEGKDGKTWVPSLGYLGVVPERKGGRYSPKGITEKPKTVSIDELKKMLK